MKLPCSVRWESLLQVVRMKTGKSTEIGLSMTREKVVSALLTPLKHSDSICCNYSIELHSICISWRKDRSFSNDWISRKQTYPFVSWR